MSDNKKLVVIHCWSAPRSRSTALLYSFESRNDCIAIDEPLYRRWLVELKDVVQRPYTDNLINGTAPPNEDGAAWKRERATFNQRIQESVKKSPQNSSGEKFIFCKHMAKHGFLFDFQNNREVPGHDIAEHDNDMEIEHKHVLLVRDPVSIVSSWNMASTIHGNTCTPDEVGIVPLLSIYSSVLSSNSSSSPILLDSDELAADPIRTLTALCEDLQLPYDPAMQSWHSGPHACDGPWAKWWYGNVHKSTGWVTQVVPSSSSNENNKDGDDSTQKLYRIVPTELLPALRASMPAYEFLQTCTNRYKLRGKPIYEDERNAHALVWVGAPGYGRILPRDLAKISPFDSSVQGGDATWEGIRIYRGKILSLEKHLKRLFRSAKALGFENVHTKDEIIDAIFQTLAANQMRDSAHMRLTLTRGEKCTSSMNPKFNVYGTTLIILPEWKPVEGATTYDNKKGVALITASMRRNSPSTCDSKIHHNNMINNILPKIQANLAGVADAIMLDVDGYVSETNATNLFLVDDEGVLKTPYADHCLPGITRATVLTLAKELNIPNMECRLSLAEFHSAEEVFTTGTMGELTPVTKIDGRIIGSGLPGPITHKLQSIYRTLPERDGWSTPIPPFHTISN